MIERAPRAATDRDYDLIVIGGGIHGAMLALQSARRGYRSLLLERSDFGGATSWNSLRIIHGGLRYLQTADLSRFRRSVTEQKWYLRHFPDLVRPLECLMPLYGMGLRRPVVLKVALLANDLLRSDRSGDAECGEALPGGSVLSRDETLAKVAAVAADGLRGGALWYDASLRDPARLLLEVLRWACSAGAVCLNYMDVVELVSEGGCVVGVRALDRAAESVFEYKAPIVVNAAGPGASELADRFGSRAPELFVPSIAFNLLLDRDWPTDTALAVDQRVPGGRTYFVRGWRGRMLAGTYHAARPPETVEATVTHQEVGSFLSDLNLALPSAELSESNVLRVMGGLLPAVREWSHELATRDVVVDHGRNGGAPGLFSVVGVKYTTARRVSEETLRTAFGGSLRPLRSEATRPEAVPSLTSSEIFAWRDRDPVGAIGFLKRLAREEAVVHADDLIYRRMDWGTDPAEAETIGRLLEETGVPSGDRPEAAEQSANADPDAGFGVDLPT
jgi:glycerol-3-phosphate dehydrogenase